MATTTDSSVSQGRSSSRRAAFAVAAAAALLVIGGCTANGNTTPDPAPATTAAAVDESVSTTTTQATTTTTETNPQSLLGAALDSYGEGYQFESIVEVGEAEAVSVTGVVIDASAQMEVVSGDGIATYLTTPEASWIRVEGGDWQKLESQGPFAPPLAALASPTSIEIIGSNSEGVAMVGIYDGALFTSEETVELKIIVRDGLLINASYVTENATVSTSFGPLDGATIETPAPAA